MQTQTLAKLAAISGLIIICSFWLNNKKMGGATQFTPQRAFPKLQANLDAVDKISIATQAGTFDIQRIAKNTWVLPSKANYPAAVPVVREVLLGIAELMNVEAKTSDPSLYSRLNLQDVTHANSEATRLSLYQGNQRVADVLLGKQRPDRANPNLNEIFIRYPDQDQSYLAKTAMSIYQTTTDWMDTRVLDIPSKNIQTIEVKPTQGEMITLKREKPEQKEFTLANAEQNTKNKSVFQANRIAQALGQITLDDVMAQSDFPTDKATPAFTADLHTFDGIKIHYVSYDYQNRHFVKMSALVDTQQNAKNTAELQKEVAKWQEKFNRWVFVIPNWQYSDINKKQTEPRSSESATEGIKE